MGNLWKLKGGGIMRTFLESSSRAAFPLQLFVLSVLMCSVAQADVWEEWAARYDGSPGEYCNAVDLAVDANGNVYVTGTTYFDDTFEDYVTVKYNPDGVQQWVVRYGGPAGDDDFAEAIAVDTDGNVFVTGWSVGIGTMNDYATVKYNSSGIEQWVARYDGPPADYDYALSLVLDGDGNVYVTGQSAGIGTNSDIATIKYNSSGIEQWVARYNSQENGYDKARSVAVDADGNVYVTGQSAIQAGGPCQTDYTTVKYNSAGTEQWVRNFNSTGDGFNMAVKIVTDALGNAYVTGFGGCFATFPYNYDYHTIKYSSAGVEQWVASYNGTGDGWDVAQSLGVDIDGNVYVVGNSLWTDVNSSIDYTTIKYNTSGQEQWVARYMSADTGANSSSLALDVFGNVYITGECNADYTTIKYDPAGTQRWVTTYDGPGTYDMANAIATDMEGYVYITGNSGGHYATVKYGQDQIVPVLLTYFDLSASGSEVRIRWQQSMASDVARFRLMRLHEGMEIELDWESSEPGHFEVVDSDPRLCQGGNFYYRLYGQLDGNNWWLLHSETLELEPLPQSLVLYQARPNPFNPQTSVGCSMTQASQVRITVHDLKGRHVATLHEGVLSAGEHSLEWKGRDALGRPVDSGIYFIHMEAPGTSQSQKVVLIK